MIKNITVIGAGSTGHALSAYLSLKGFDITLYEFDEELKYRLEDIKENGGILLRGEERGFATIHKLTYDAREAVENADLIIACVIAYKHEETARLIAPYIKDGQHILLAPGNLGAFVFRNIFKDMGVNKDITLTELESNFFGVRLTGKAEAIVSGKYSAKTFSTLPASDMPKVKEALKDVVELIPRKNIFDATINSNNYITHLGGTLLSGANIEMMGANFCMYLHGMTPAVIKITEKLREERNKIAAAMGLSEYANPVPGLIDIMNADKTPPLPIPLAMDGPDKIDHRYLTEDAFVGGAFAISVARKLGIKVPLLEAVVEMSGALLDKDYINNGRTLENLGFSGSQSFEEIMASI